MRRHGAAGVYEELTALTRGRTGRGRQPPGLHPGARSAGGGEGAARVPPSRPTTPASRPASPARSDRAARPTSHGSRSRAIQSGCRILTTHEARVGSADFSGSRTSSPRAVLSWRAGFACRDIDSRVPRPHSALRSPLHAAPEPYGIVIVGVEPVGAFEAKAEVGVDPQVETGTEAARTVVGQRHAGMRRQEPSPGQGRHTIAPASRQPGRPPPAHSRGTQARRPAPDDRHRPAPPPRTAPAQATSPGRPSPDQDGKAPQHPIPRRPNRSAAAEPGHSTSAVRPNLGST